MRFPLLRSITLFVGLSSLTLATEFHANFSDGFGPWQKSPTGNWEIQTVGENKVAALTAAGEQPGGVRRPTGFLLLPQFAWTDYAISLRAKTLEPASIVQRDVVVIFGYVDATHFYYVHVSSDSDDRFHNIMMKVDGETRTTIDQQIQPEARLTDDWHNIRVEHDANGSIRVFVDDMTSPLMTAADTAYPAGAVGFGCFDDRALFDDVIIAGDALPAPKSNLTNLSTRSIVPTASDSLVAGVVIDGSRPQTVLIRAAGPSLSDFGVTGAMLDPQLQVFRSSDGAQIATNDNWNESANESEVAATAQSVGAFPFATGSLDAALMLTLEPGAYTAQIKGQAGATGVALVEVYTVSAPL